jgi:hypothetical protein
VTTPRASSPRAKSSAKPSAATHPLPSCTLQGGGELFLKKRIKLKKEKSRGEVDNKKIKLWKKIKTHGHALSMVRAMADSLWQTAMAMVLWPIFFPIGIFFLIFIFYLLHIFYYIFFFSFL